MQAYKVKLALDEQQTDVDVGDFHAHYYKDAKLYNVQYHDVYIWFTGYTFSYTWNSITLLDGTKHIGTIFFNE